jgi:hypothetical protein
MEAQLSKNEQASNVWLYGLGVLALVGVVIGGLYITVSHYFNTGELGTKKYYAVLQGVEFDFRSNKDPNPILKENVDGSGLDVLGVPGKSTPGTRVWVVLNQIGPDGQVLLMPQGIDLKLDCAALKRATEGRQVIEPVRQYLAKACTPG